MMDIFAFGVHSLGVALTLCATAYAILAWHAVALPPAMASMPSNPAQPVSVLKPLHGAEPNLYGNLRGFCAQAHPQFEIVFGIQDPADPAIEVVTRLRAEFPNVAIALVVDPRMHGANRKVGNLINMLPQARHDWLVIADSDISVPPDYLARVTAPLLDRDVGVVTCLYRGIARGGLWSQLGRLFIDDWFAPSVRLAHRFGSTRFAFGSTLALRRETLAAIGGFEALKDLLADDFWLGEFTRRAGRTTVLSDLTVGTDVEEDDFMPLWTHELRWLRTIRSVAPAGFAMTFICFTSPVLLAGLLLAPTASNVALAMLGLAARILLNLRQRHRGDGHRDTAPWWRDVALIPLRDTLLLLEWGVALSGWNVQWRGETLHARDNHPPA